ncbi:helix-turn-helix domain-containing protein [Sphingomonas jatrophae]|uniref:DNA-binding transcriptional regulator, CsgD family n=1 Tax=Sphingomonas jatrophae TaxID=1166337 RepID=A0A1I6K348_9SPHN|nr:helix-turn-helix transcriptional regulator [Sphingomonas jatrophae]SFR85649.1 DNA-binding transcriptional regulator, CsgD family [Sphingomonas jatrophae]
MDESVGSAPDKISSLTPRERTCLLAAAEGLTAKEIALSLGIGYRTVQNYQQEAARKLGVTGTVRAARMLIEAERHTPVDVHPAPAVVADQSITAAPDEPPAELQTAAKPANALNTENTINTSETVKQVSADAPEAFPGRIVQLTPERVLWLTLAWAVGFSAVLALVAELYRLAL